MAEMRLYDLRVTVERIEGRSVCGLQVGDYFEVTESNRVRIPAGKHFCLYALQSVMPLLPAKQRKLPDEDWLEQDSLVCCPDPDERVVMRIERTAERVLRTEDLTSVQLSLGLQSDKRPDEYVALARTAEEGGLDAVSVYHDLFFQPAIAPLLLMARETERVRLGPAALNPYTLHPVEIAGQIAALDFVSNGRAYLGLVQGAWLDRLGLEAVAAALCTPRGRRGGEAAARRRQERLRRRAVHARARCGVELRAATARGAAHDRDVGAADGGVRGHRGPGGEARRVREPRG